MKTRLWTPLHIDLMLWYYCRCEPWPQAEAEAPREYTEHLRVADLIEATTEQGTCPYRATSRGKAFIEAICDTPIPKRAFIGAHDEVIYSEQP